MSQTSPAGDSSGVGYVLDSEGGDETVGLGDGDNRADSTGITAGSLRPFDLGPGG
jgi:hypothetical protein